MRRRGPCGAVVPDLQRRVTDSLHQSDAPSTAAPLGLIAGAGALPHIVARGARRAGRRLVIVGLRDVADETLASEADVFVRRGIVRLGGWIRVFRRHGVREAIMAGRVDKTRMLAMPAWRQWIAYCPDLTSIRVWYFRARDRRNDTLLSAVADELHRKGIEMIDSTRYCPDALAPAGVLTVRAPSAAEQADIELGWRMAREMGRLDVGQSVAVKDRDVIAVEAIEGTDRMIRRAGELCPAGGWTLVKVAKPNQDARFDVPTVGPETVVHLHRCGGSVLVVEAGRTLVIDRDIMIREADARGLTVVGWTGDGQPSAAH